DMSLASAANEVHNFLKSAATKEHFIDLIDWVEDQRPKLLISRAFAGSEKTVSIFVSSRQSHKEGLLCHDYGESDEDEDWIVYMHLPKKHLNYIEANASHMFNPLTSDYLNI
ncbi:hypothetical protein Tco_1550224, partial [Tanacetum coccineum]